jgi:Na+-driven multidrug efflux pump
MIALNILRILTGIFFGLSLAALYYFAKYALEGDKKKALERLLFFLMALFLTLILYLLNENVIAPNIHYLE